MAAIKNKGLLYGMGGLLVVVLVLKFTVLKKKDEMPAGFQQGYTGQSSASRDRTRARPKPQQRPSQQQRPTTKPGTNNAVQKPGTGPAKPVSRKKAFNGYEQIKSNFTTDTAEMTEAMQEAIVVQNVFQDFKKSYEQQNNAKLAMIRAQEALNKLRVTNKGLTENYRRGLEKYMETSQNYLDSAETFFVKSSYLEAENYADRAYNHCENFSLVAIENLIKETVTFKYRGFYDVEDKQVAILLMIRNATGVIEGVSKKYLYSKEGDLIKANEYNSYKLLKVDPEYIRLQHIKTNDRNETEEGKVLTINYETMEKGEGS